MPAPEMMLKYLISLVLIATSFCTLAQTQGQVKQKADSLIAELDSSTMYIPTGIRIGTDVISMVKTFSKDNYTELNFYADIDFHKYLFNVEYGRVERSLFNDSAAYHVKGSYFKFGPDINFLYKDPDRSALFFGLRYAFTKFSDDLSYIKNDPTYGLHAARIENDAINAKWFELVGGLKVKIWKTMWLGYTARFKFGVNSFEDEKLIPNTIPGYGRADERVTWGFNYWLIFRIPVRNSPVPFYPKK